MSRGRVMGRDNQLPWHYPEDLKFFREKTKGSVLILGRKTYDSLGKPLPGRYHIVISRNPPPRELPPMVAFVKSWSEAKAAASKKVGEYPPEVFVLGGAEIFRISLPDCHRLYLTVIDKDYAGDVLFPDFSSDQWFLKEKRPGDNPDLDFQTWINKDFIA